MAENLLWYAGILEAQTYSYHASFELYKVINSGGSLSLPLCYIDNKRAKRDITLSLKVPSAPLCIVKVLNLNCGSN